MDCQNFCSDLTFEETPRCQIRVSARAKLSYSKVDMLNRLRTDSDYLKKLKQ